LGLLSIVGALEPFRHVPSSLAFVPDLCQVKSIREHYLREVEEVFLTRFELEQLPKTVEITD
jgi:hypothetical protein